MVIALRSLSTSESARREFDEHALGFAIGEIKSSHPSNTGSNAAFFIENELPDGVESGQARLGKSIVLAGRIFGPL
jgi:hypothetical protein